MKTRVKEVDQDGKMFYIAQFKMLWLFWVDIDQCWYETKQRAEVACSLFMLKKELM